MLGLALSASLWWTYFADERQTESALRAANADERPRLALTIYGYLHFFLLLGIVFVASGLKSATPHPLEELPAAPAAVLGAGTAMFVVADAAMARVLRIGGTRVRAPATVVAALASIPVGLTISAAAQVGALVASLAIATGSRQSTLLG
jgi:low temperature requirement protein LtrA